MKSKIMEMAKDPRAVLVFDIDGVLAAYEYGERNHNACRDDEWEEFMKTHDVYEDARPIKTIQNFLKKYTDPTRVFACSVAESYEVDQKKKFVTDNYLIPKENVICVQSKKEKLKVLKMIRDTKFPKLDEKWIIMVEDTTGTLTDIQENSNFSTMHISSFLE